MSSPSSDPSYTVFIRLPFPRGDFVDPPPANWDSSKDEALWNIVSRVSKTEIDWNEIAGRFQVTVDFLLQQVAWLTERHAAQLRAQMRRAAVAAKGSSAPSPQPGAEAPFAAEAMRRTGSGGGGVTRSRAPSSLSIRKFENSVARNDSSRPGTPVRTNSRLSNTRVSSSNTTTTTAARNLGGSTTATARQPVPPNAGDSQRRRLSSLPITTNAADIDSGRLSPDPAEASQPDSPSPSDSSSSSSSPAQSRIIRRPPRFRSNDAPSSYADEEDDDDHEPAFHPYQPHAGTSSSGQHHDLSATLRGDQKRLSKHSSREHRVHHSQHSDSSSSSAAAAFRGPSDKGAGPATGPLSPRRTMELAGRSPGVKGKGHSRDSDGTPSMGSSFSDLDDASVTQSALEEALASKMGDGGTIASLRGTIGNAFRARYTPKNNN